MDPNTNHYDEWEAERTQEAREYYREYLGDFHNSTTGHIQVVYTTNYTKSTVEYVLAKVYHMLIGHGIIFYYTVRKHRGRCKVFIDILPDTTIYE